MNSILSEKELTALTEIFNVGAGRAALEMSRMVGGEILLSVPETELVGGQVAIEAHPFGNRLCAVHQHFEGTFSTDALLMFAEEKSLELVRIMVGESIPLEQLSEMAQEALGEIGNIILNSVLAAMADALETEFTSTLPFLRMGSMQEIMALESAPAEGVLLLLRVDFFMESKEIRGSLAFLLSLTSAGKLKSSLTRFIAREEK